MEAPSPWVSIASPQDCGELRRAIEGCYRVGWIAGNSGDTLAQCRRALPGVLLIDIALPGAAALTRRIMRETPCPVAILACGLDNQLAGVFEAMSAGALDVITLRLPLDAGGQALLLKKLKTLARAALQPQSPAPPPKAPTLPPLIAIGASTGGPLALQRILAALPPTLNATLVLIQHVGWEFSTGMAEWLNGQTPLPVQIAPHNGPIQAGRVYVAGTNDHLTVTRERCFAYAKEPLDLPYRPSVDVFFHSLAQHWPVPGLAALLTGMGRDGAEGLAALRGRGWHTIAQDQASSVVYGMPKAACQLGAVCEVLPLEQIAPALLNWLAGSVKPLPEALSKGGLPKG